MKASTYFYILLNLLILTEHNGVNAVKTSKAREGLHRNPSPISTTKQAILQSEPLPDLNYPPPAETQNDLTKNSLQPSRSVKKSVLHIQNDTYAQRTEKKRREGTLQAWKARKAELMRLYRANLSKEKKRENVQYDNERKRKLFAIVRMISICCSASCVCVCV